MHVILDLRLKLGGPCVQKNNSNDELDASDVQINKIFKQLSNSWLYKENKAMFYLGVESVNVQLTFSLVFPRHQWNDIYGSCMISVNGLIGLKSEAFPFLKLWIIINY